MTPRLVSAAIALVFVVSWAGAAAWAGRKTASSTARELKILYAAGAAFLAALGAATLALPSMRERLWPAAAALDWPLVVIFTAGLAFCWWARLHIGRLWAGGVLVREGHRVVDTGPYAIVRHPIYFGAFVAMVPFCAIRARPADLLFAAGFIVFFAMKARIEEGFLVAQLGADYEAYRRRVPMLLPLPRVS